ncbi:MAG: flagellar FlbD family protein [bacterium]
MIPLTRLNGQNFYLNLDFIESIEACPDTLITLTNGKHLLVQETPDEISDRVLSLRRYLQGTGPRPVFLKPMTENAETNSGCLG